MSILNAADRNKPVSEIARGYVSAYLQRLISILIGPLSLLNSIPLALRNEIPAVISEPMNVVSKIASQFMSEVKDLQEHLDQRIELSSPVKAAAQWRGLARNWRQYEVLLADTIRQILAAKVRLEDEFKDPLLNEALLGALNELGQVLDDFEAMDADSLTEHPDGVAGRMVRLFEGKRLPVQANIYRLSHELLEPLGSLFQAYAILRKEVPPAVSGPIEVIGRVSYQFISDIVDLRNHLDATSALSPVEAAAQMRQLAAGWKEHQALLSEAVQQVQASGIRMGDELLDRVMGSLAGSIEELARGMRFLETVQAEHLTGSSPEGTD